MDTINLQEPFAAWPDLTVVATGHGYVSYDNLTGEQLASMPEPGAEQRIAIDDGHLLAAVAGSRAVLLDFVVKREAAQGLSPSSSALYARGLDPRTLQQLWSTRISSCRRCAADDMDGTYALTAGASPTAIVGVYTSSGSSLADGIDVSTGRLLWTNKRLYVLEAAGALTAHILSTIAGPNIILGESGTGRDGFGDPTDTDVLVDPKTGTIRSTVFPGISNESGETAGVEEVNGPYALVNRRSRPALLIDVSKGRTVAEVRYAVAIDGAAGVLLAKTAVGKPSCGACGPDLRLSAMSLTTGKLLWTQKVPVGYCGDLADSVYVTANGQLVTLSATTGKQTDYQPGGCRRLPSDFGDFHIGSIHIHVAPPLDTDQNTVTAYEN